MLCNTIYSIERYSIKPIGSRLVQSLFRANWKQSSENLKVFLGCPQPIFLSFSVGQAIHVCALSVALYLAPLYEFIMSRQANYLV